MATGVGTDFKIYQEYINGAAFETVMQFVEVFGEGSNGAMVMRPQPTRGDYDYESFFLEGAAVERRDPNDVTTLTDNPILQEEIVGVKLHRGFHRALTRNQWLRIGQAPERFATIYGGQLGRQMMKEEVDTAISAVSAALSAQAALNHDATDGTLAHTDLISGISKFGDAGGDIVAWVMHSKQWYDLVGSAITSTLLEVGGVAVNRGTTGTAGRPVIVTDSASLVVAGSPLNYITLGLVRGAVNVVETEALYTADQEVTGLKNIVRRLQTEYAYNLKLKGIKYNTSGGGLNPDATAIGTSSNWTKVATDNKSLPGVRITSL